MYILDREPSAPSSVSICTFVPVKARNIQERVDHEHASKVTLSQRFS